MGALAALCVCAVWWPAAAAAQEEPTPFWMPVDPGPADNAKPKQKGSAKKKPPAKGPDAQVYIAGDADDEPAPKKKTGKGTVKSVKPAPKSKARPAREPADEPPAPAEPRPVRKKFEPLPSFPHLEPEAAPAREKAPSIAPPEPAREPTAPAAEPVRRPVLRPSKEAFGAEDDEPAKPSPAPAPAGTTPSPAPATKEKEKAKKQAPPPARSAPLVTDPGPQALLPEPGAANAAREVEPEEAAPLLLRWRRNLWVLGVAGGWQKPHGDSRGFEVAYGLQVGWAPLPWLLLDLDVARAGQSQGNGFASARVDHTLLLLRAFAAWNRSSVSLFAGGGFGCALSQTLYTLQDVGQPASTLPATAFKLAGQVGGGVRMRPWSGLEARAEVTTLLRDGRLEPLVTFGAGWAF